LIGKEGWELVKRHGKSPVKLIKIAGKEKVKEIFRELSKFVGTVVIGRIFGISPRYVRDLFEKLEIPRPKEREKKWFAPYSENVDKPLYFANIKNRRLAIYGTKLSPLDAHLIGLIHADGNIVTNRRDWYYRVNIIQTSLERFPYICELYFRYFDEQRIQRHQTIYVEFHKSKVIKESNKLRRAKVNVATKTIHNYEDMRLVLNLGYKLYKEKKANSYKLGISNRRLISLSIKRRPYLDYVLKWISKDKGLFLQWFSGFLEGDGYINLYWIEVKNTEKIFIDYIKKQWKKYGIIWKPPYVRKPQSLSNSYGIESKKINYVIRVFNSKDRIPLLQEILPHIIFPDLIAKVSSILERKTIKKLNGC